MTGAFRPLPEDYRAKEAQTEPGLLTAAQNTHAQIERIHTRPLSGLWRAGLRRTQAGRRVAVQQLPHGVARDRTPLYTSSVTSTDEPAMAPAINTPMPTLMTWPPPPLLPMPTLMTWPQPPRPLPPPREQGREQGSGLREQGSGPPPEQPPSPTPPPEPPFSIDGARLDGVQASPHILTELAPPWAAPQPALMRVGVSMAPAEPEPLSMHVRASRHPFTAPYTSCLLLTSTHARMPWHLYLPLTTHVEASWDLRPLTYVGPSRLLTRLELCLTPAVSSCRANSASEAANEQHCNKDPTLLSELGFFTCDLISDELMSTILAEQIAPYHINGTRTSVTVLVRIR